MKPHKIYKIARLIPGPVRKVVKIFYNPKIPVISKLDYGEIAFPENSMNFLLDMFKLTLLKKVKGDIIEFGAYKGGTTIRLAKCLRELGIKDRIVYGLDTFEGMPERTKEDSLPEFFEGSMDNVDIDKLNELIKKENLEEVIALRKGLFKETLLSLKDKRFCFAFIDCVLYNGTKQALEFLIPRMNRGGIIVIDDYFSKNLIGVKKAVLEFFKEDESITYMNKLYFFKIQ